MEVRRRVLLRPDHEAFGARGPVPPGHAQRGRVDEGSVAPARAGVADPVRRERCAWAEAPLVAQAGRRARLVRQPRGRPGWRHQRAREQSRSVDLPSKHRIRPRPAYCRADADEFGGRKGDAQVERPGIGRENGGGWPDRAPGVAGQHDQGDPAVAVPGGCREVPVPPASSTGPAEWPRDGASDPRPHDHADSPVLADAQLPARSRSCPPSGTGVQTASWGRTTASLSARPWPGALLRSATR